jgi:reactive intermediate/imine deaminase
MHREQIRTDEAPAPSGSYSQAIRSGSLLFLAGQGPYTPDGAPVVGTVAEQTRQVLENLRRVAEAAGGRLEDAVRVGVYLSSLDHFDEMDTMYRTQFTAPLPARTTIQSDLVGFDVEMDAVVALPG